jgi:hypothetical protein
VDVAQIEEVDVIWDKPALHDCISPDQHHSFDYCIASHVIEHIPDPIRFLRSLETLFTPRGLLSLAVPDKRFCFDAFKPISTTADWLAAHSAHRSGLRHSAKSRYENTAYNVVGPNEARAWGQHPIDDLRIFSPLAGAAAPFDQAAADADSPYQDCHAWYFTPSSFRLLLIELRALGKTRFVVESLSGAAGCEFFARLRLDPEAPAMPSDEQRLALMMCVLAEHAEQLSFVSPELWRKLSRALPADHPAPRTPFAHGSTLRSAARAGVWGALAGLKRALDDSSSRVVSRRDRAKQP